jgi:hypothetical protein
MAELDTLGHVDASGREISAPDKRTRSNDGQPERYQLARWVSTDNALVLIEAVAPAGHSQLELNAVVAIASLHSIFVLV